MIKIKETLQKDTWVKPYLKKYQRSLFLALLLGVITFFCGSALMFNSGFLISKSASLPENILMVYVPIVLTRTFGIGRPVFRYLERLVSHNWVLKMTSDLRLKLYQHLEKDAIFFKGNHRMGDILGLLAEDINHIQNLYLRTIFPTVIAYLLYGGVVIALGFFSWWFAFVMLFLLGVVVFVFPVYSLCINGARQEKEKYLKHQLYENLTDNVLGVSDWIFSNRGTEYVTYHEKTEEKLRSLRKESQNFHEKRDFLLQVFLGVVTIVLFIWTSMTFKGNHGGKANFIAAFILSVFPLIDAFSPLSVAFEETNIYDDSLKRLNQLPEKKDLTLSKVILKEPLDLKIQDLSFTYEDGVKEVLHQLNLDFPAGEKVAILGRSGSGKTTLAHLIRGDLKPTAGKITLNGYETSQLGDGVSDYLGVLQQTPYLFHTTLFNNLVLGSPQTTEKEAWNVLKRVGLKEMVESLPEGLETMVDEAGTRFSGGEAHRIALARILLKNPPIILLDEPTVGLDPMTEEALLQVFFRELKDKTVIWITHHLQGIELVNQVLFIEDGKLTMSGSPEELKATSPHYRYLKAMDEGDNM